ncbi:MAG TPA: response regulator [Gemmatirosa sp.]
MTSGASGPPPWHGDGPHGNGPRRDPGTTLRVVVADDERPARSFLVALLRGSPDVEVVGEAADGAEAVALIERTRPDLALLDLQMPELDGIGVVHALERTLRREGRARAALPLVAFVTAYDAYAVRAFEVHAVDYLLKPVDGPRLRRTLMRAHERLERADMRADAGDRLLAATAVLTARSPAAAALDRIPVRRRDDVLLVPVAQLLAVVADGELLHLHTLGGERHTISYRLKDLEARLPAGAFVRLSRGALARLDAIRVVSPMPGGLYVVTLAGGMQLPVSRLRSRYVREQLLRL